ncbi:MAG: hypothetical protein AAF806_30885, partial [Bacteroidota bacterium]
MFGELFGGKTTAFSKNYGKEAYGFRVFDIAEIDDLSILEKPIPRAYRSGGRQSRLDDGRYRTHLPSG